MKEKYFNSVGSIESHVQIFPHHTFIIIPQPRACECGTVRIAYEVTDRQDNDIIEILVVCPLCVNNPKNSNSHDSK